MRLCLGRLQNSSKYEYDHTIHEFSKDNVDTNLKEFLSFISFHEQKSIALENGG